MNVGFKILLTIISVIIFTLISTSNSHNASSSVNGFSDSNYKIISAVSFIALIIVLVIIWTRKSKKLKS